jgi:hypothetical protein
MANTFYVVTVITNHPDDVPLTKTYRLNKGRLVKETAAQLKSGSYKVMRVNTPKAFMELWQGLTPAQTLAYGVPKALQRRHTNGGIYSTNVFSRRSALGRINDGDTTRKKDDFMWYEGWSVMMLDYDPQDGAKVMTHDEILAALGSAVPAMRNAPMVLAHSTSTYIYDKKTGEQLKGDGGKRVYVFVANGTDIEHFAAILIERLWLKGYGFFTVNEDGNASARTIIDTTVFQPQRFDFSGASCSNDLEQRRPPAIVVNPDATPLDISSKAFRRLSAKQVHTVNDRKGTERAKVKGECNAVLTKRAELHKGEGLSGNYAGIAKSRYLPLDFVVQVNATERVTVKALMNSKITYLRDPLEPSYGGDRDGVAWVKRHESGEVTIFSHAHGGQVYFLPDPDNVLSTKKRRMGIMATMPLATGVTAFDPALLPDELTTKIDATRGYEPETAFFAVIQSAMRNGMVNAKELYQFLNSLAVEHPASSLWREAKSWGQDIFDAFWMRVYFKSLDDVHPFGSLVNPDPDEIGFTKPEFMTAANDKNMKGAA